LTYTGLAVLAVGLTVVLDLAVLRTKVLQRKAFWVSYLIVVVFQLVANGVLTGFNIVKYDGAAIIGSSQPSFIGGWRVAYAPVEDLLFGFALVVQTIAWWAFWGRRGVQREPMAGPPRWWLRRSTREMAGANRPAPRTESDRTSL
jgi:lycopene cyclase domain-containing protein